MTLSESYEQLRQLINEGEDDVKKCEGGNKAAGTRVRKRLQDVKNHSQEMRKLVLEQRSDD